MKPITFVFIFVTLTTTVLSAPAADWDVVESKVQELRALVLDTVEFVRNTAFDDNINVGVIIGRKLDAATAQARIEFEKAVQLIGDRTFTRSDADNIMIRLAAILMQLQLDMADDVARLTEPAQVAIRTALENGLVQAEDIAEELYAALD